LEEKNEKTRKTYLHASLRGALFSGSGENHGKRVWRGKKELRTEGFLSKESAQLRKGSYLTVQRGGIVTGEGLSRGREKGRKFS